MIKLTLERMYLPDRTIGVLRNCDTCSHEKRLRLMTLEPPWRDNMVNVSCIPEGAYLCVRDKHGKWQAYRVQDVWGRTAIEFHEGRDVVNTDGCILLGESLSSINKLIGSSGAVTSLLEYVGDSSFLLQVKLGNRNTFR